MISKLGADANTADDGIVLVELTDFIRNLKVLEITHYNPTHVHSTHEILDDDGTSKDFTIEWTGGDFSVTVDHYHSRMYPIGCRSDWLQYDEWSKASLTLSDPAGNILGDKTCYDAKMSNNFLEVGDLAAGTYYVSVHNYHWDTNTVHDLTLRIYGAGTATIEVSSEEEEEAQADAALESLRDTGLSVCNGGAWTSNFYWGTPSATLEY